MMSDNRPWRFPPKPRAASRTRAMWQRWRQSVSGVMRALVGVHGLFGQHQAPLGLQVAANSVQAMLGGQQQQQQQEEDEEDEEDEEGGVRVDATLLRLLAEVSPATVAVLEGDGGEVIQVMVPLLEEEQEEQEEQGGGEEGAGTGTETGEKRKRTAGKTKRKKKRRPRRVACMENVMPRFLEDLERFVQAREAAGAAVPPCMRRPATQEEKIAGELAAIGGGRKAGTRGEEEQRPQQRQQRRPGEGKGGAEEEEQDAVVPGQHEPDRVVMQSFSDGRPAVVANLGGWRGGQAVSCANFLGYLAAQSDYHGQVQHVHCMQGREASTIPLDAVQRECNLHPDLERGVRNVLGISALYVHQYLALKAAMVDNKHPLISTATASGKSLCYTLPIISRLMHVGADGMTALLIFPTKALAHDQLRALQCFQKHVCPGALRACCYDGDTPMEQREELRTTCNVILTNPDTIHISILPRHAEWAEFLRRLQFLVVDECHVMGGAFGTHCSLVLRRLRRVAGMYGSVPRFVCSSATIANPAGFMSRLTGCREDDIAVVSRDGSPAGPKSYVLWNPPLRKRHGGVRSHRDRRRETLESTIPDNTPLHGADVYRTSAFDDTAWVLAHLVRNRIRTLVFVRARQVAELILIRTRKLLPPECAGMCASYRGGFLPQQRRQIERKLKDGQLFAVISTNALELGIDIGVLDATCHVGFPGSMCSLLQQAGRAGRTGAPSLAVYIAHDDALDQHFIRGADTLFRRPIEPATIDPNNEYVLREHLLCAAFEQPLNVATLATSFPPNKLAATASSSVSPSSPVSSSSSSSSSSTAAAPVVIVAESLVRKGKLVRQRVTETVQQSKLHEGQEEEEEEREDEEEQTRIEHAEENETRTTTEVLRCVAPTGRGGCKRWAGPARAINIRSIDNRNVALVDAASASMLESMDFYSAIYKVFEGSVYLSQGATYLVEEMDYSTNVAKLRAQEAPLPYYTRKRGGATITITGLLSQWKVHTPAFNDGLAVRSGTITVRKSIWGFLKIDSKSHRLRESCELPEMGSLKFDTTATWVHVPGAIKNHIDELGRNFDQGGLHTIEHVLIALAPAVISCDPGDLSCQHERRESDKNRQLLLLFETNRGGTGLTQLLGDHIQLLLGMALQHLAACPCEGGCPSCCFSPSCGEFNEGLDKRCAVIILRMLLESDDCT